MDREAEVDRVDLSGLAYGVRLAGRLPKGFAEYLVPHDAGGTEAPSCVEVTYRSLSEPPRADEVWGSDTDWPPGGGHFGLFRQPEGGFGLTVSAEGRGVFRCTSRSIGIEWAPPGTGAAHYLFAYALPIWLESEGVPVLHGSAVSLGGRAVGFVGRSGIGKSVLCAELLRLGCGFLADDGLALRRDKRRDRRGVWRCAQGPPLLRLWPSGLEGRLEIPAHPLPRVHETLEKRQLLLGGESANPRPAGPPLAALYVLERRREAAGPVEVSRYSPREALVRLLEHGIAGSPAAALGLSGRRLELLADLAETVSVRELRFPSGAESAERILNAIESELGIGS